MPPESVLAIDLGAMTGWAFHDQAGMVCGTKPILGDSLGHTLSTFKVWVADAIDEMRPEIVVYEDPTKFGHGFKQRIGMACAIEMVSWRLERACLPIAITKIKHHATGHGHASKTDMITAARGMGWRPATDHEADALWMAHYAMHEINVRRGKAA